MINDKTSMNCRKRRGINKVNKSVTYNTQVVDLSQFERLNAAPRAASRLGGSWMACPPSLWGFQEPGRPISALDTR